MNSKGHFFISLVKSLFRIIACILALCFQDSAIIIISLGFVAAEILGIFEELADKR